MIGVSINGSSGQGAQRNLSVVSFEGVERMKTPPWLEQGEAEISSSPVNHRSVAPEMGLELCRH